jgi:hypothetical protein
MKRAQEYSAVAPKKVASLGSRAKIANRAKKANRASQAKAANRAKAASQNQDPICQSQYGT